MINIKTLAAALALTVVSAGSAHAASCTFHFRIHNQGQEEANLNSLINYRRLTFGKSQKFDEKIAAGEVRDFSRRINRKANDGLIIAVRGRKDPNKVDADPDNIIEFQSSPSYSCNESFKQKQEGHPVTIYINIK